MDSFFPVSVPQIFLVVNKDDNMAERKATRDNKVQEKNPPFLLFNLTLPVVRNHPWL